MNIIQQAINSIPPSVKEEALGLVKPMTREQSIAWRNTPEGQQQQKKMMDMVMQMSMMGGIKTVPRWQEGSTLLNGSTRAFKGWTSQIPMENLPNLQVNPNNPSQFLLKKPGAVSTLITKAIDYLKRNPDNDQVVGLLKRIIVGP
jgi:hypothetical protein